MNLLKNHCYTASKLLAASLYKLFPQISILQEWVDSPYFALEVVFPFDLNDQIFALISDRLKEIAKKKPEARFFEMVPFSAKALAEHSNREDLKEILEDWEDPLVPMVEIDNFIDIASYEFDMREFSATSFALLSYEFIETSNKMSVYRLIGCVGDSQNAVKEYKKVFKNHFALSHKILGQKLGLFHLLSDEKLYWLENGQYIREKLFILRKQSLQEEGFLMLEGEGANKGNLLEIHQALADKLHNVKIAESFYTSEIDKEDFLKSLFNLPSYFSDINHIFFKKENMQENLKSCLLLLCKIPKIFGLDHEGVLYIPSKALKKESTIFKDTLEELKFSFVTEESIESELSFHIQLKDGMGRSWNIASCTFLGIKNKTSSFKLEALRFSLLHSIDRLVYLLLEQKKGVLPKALQAEEARIIPLIDNDELIFKAKYRLEKEGLRVKIDQTEGSLSDRLKKAWKERIPYAIILGSKELQQDAVTLIELETHSSKLISLEEVSDFLLKQRA